jgi:hypothetical protein
MAILASNYCFLLTLGCGCIMPAKKFWPSLSVNSKKKIVIRTLLSSIHHDYRLDYERYFLGGKFENSKLFCHFYYTERLPQVIYVRLL